MGVFKKNGNWRIDFYHQGKRIRRKVGASKKVAEMALADIEVKKAKQEFLGVCEPKRILFKDYADEYLEYAKANKAESSYERDKTTIDKHLTPLWGDEYLHRITAKMIEDYKVQRIEHVVATTVTRELFTLKNMLRKAVERGYLKRYSHLAPDHMRNAVKVLDGIAGQREAHQAEILDGHYLDTDGKKAGNRSEEQEFPQKIRPRRARVGGPSLPPVVFWAEFPGRTC